MLTKIKKMSGKIDDLCLTMNNFAEIIREQDNYIKFLESMISDNSKSKLYVLKRIEFYKNIESLKNDQD